MSLYGQRNSSVNDRLQRNRPTRKESTGTEANTNGNNNKGLESYISNYTRNAGNFNRSSVSRTPGGLRMKSNLVGSMTATFEQLNKDSLPPSGASTVKSSSYSRLDATTTTTPAQKTITTPANVPRIENGTANGNHTPKIVNTPKMENGSADKKDIDDNDAERTPPRAKSSSSARRGKQQREKRMLRQKRRSTGVVRLPGSDDEQEKEKKDNEQNEEKDEEATRKSETEKNTLSNEMSPPPSANSVKTDSERTRSYETTDAGSSILKKPSTTSTSSTPSHSHQASDNVFLSGDSTPQSPNMPMLNSSRRRGKRSPYEKSPDSSENREVDELREKLAAAESTIGKLTKEVEEMETDIKHLAEENSKLKHENKLLEDENSSMLMVLKQLRSSRE